MVITENENLTREINSTTNLQRQTETSRIRQVRLSWQHGFQGSRIKKRASTVNPSSVRIKVPDNRSIDIDASFLLLQRTRP